MMTIELSMFISVVSVCAAVFFGYQAFKRNNTQDIEENASMNARVMTKLDMISDNIKDIQRDNQDLRRDVINLKERVGILEHDAEKQSK